MKLYSSTLCVGLLVVFWCRGEDPKIISDFCRNTQYSAMQIMSLTPEETRSMAMAQRRANLSLLLKRKKFKC
jgi:hypothetical protein